MDYIPDNKLWSQETQNKNSKTQKINCHCLQSPKLKKKQKQNKTKQTSYNLLLYSTNLEQRQACIVGSSKLMLKSDILFIFWVNQNSNSGY